MFLDPKAKKKRNRKKAERDADENKLLQKLSNTVSPNDGCETLEKKI